MNYDENIVSGVNRLVLHGTVAAAPQERTFPSGARMARVLVCVRQEHRTDVLPVTVWDPEPELLAAERGAGIQIVGEVHRRFWTDSEGRHSQMIAAADTVKIFDPAELAAADE